MFNRTGNFYKMHRNSVISTLSKLPKHQSFFFDKKEKKVVVYNQQLFAAEVVDNLFGLDSIQSLVKKIKKEGYRLICVEKPKNQRENHEVTRFKARITQLQAKQDQIAELCMKIMSRSQEVMKANVGIWDSYKHKIQEFEKRLENVVANAMLRGISNEKLKKNADKILDYFKVETKQIVSKHSDKHMLMNFQNAQIIDQEEQPMDFDKQRTSQPSKMLSREKESLMIEPLQQVLRSSMLVSMSFDWNINRSDYLLLQRSIDPKLLYEPARVKAIMQNNEQN